jgi:hypothetical protein
LKNSFFERGDEVSLGVLVARVVKDSHDCGIAAREDSCDASTAPAIGARRGQFDQYLIALHGAIYFGGWNEDVVICRGLARIGADEAEAVAMHVEAAGDEAGAGGSVWESPVIFGFDQVSAGDEAIELRDEEATFFAAAESEFPYELLVTDALAWGACDTRE